MREQFQLRKRFKIIYRQRGTAMDNTGPDIPPFTGERVQGTIVIPSVLVTFP
jgi:hypothetical protein